jgi:hypothetical protein
VLVVSIFLEEHDKWAYPLIHADAVEYIFILLGGEIGGPASRSRVTTSVVDVVVFALFVRSLFVRSLFVRSLSLSTGFALFLVRSLFSLSVRGVRSVGFVHYIDWDSGCRSIQSTLHFTPLCSTATSSVSSFGVFSRHIRGSVRILGGVGGGWWEVFVILLILVVASIRNNPLHDFD